MPSQGLHPDTTPVVRYVGSLANRQNQQKCGPSGDSQLPPAKRHVSVPAGKRNSSQGKSSVASTIEGRNSTPSSSLKNTRVADITQPVISTPAATQQQSINTPTATPGIPAPGGTSQTDSTHRVVSSPASGIDSTPTPPSSLENLPTLIPNPEASEIISNPLRMKSAERNQRQRKCQLQPLAVSTPRSVVNDNCSIHPFGHWDLTHLVLATGRLPELYMWNSDPSMSPSDMEMVSYAMRHVVKALAEAPHW